MNIFERQLENIREIRLSERKFYQKVTPIFMLLLLIMTKIQIQPDCSLKQFKNKLHYATHRHTAAELIVERADHNKEHMGLTFWENAPDGKIVKSECQ